MLARVPSFARTSRAAKLSQGQPFKNVFVFELIAPISSVRWIVGQIFRRRRILRISVEEYSQSAFLATGTFFKPARLG